MGWNCARRVAKDVADEGLMRFVLVSRARLRMVRVADIYVVGEGI